MKQEICWPFWPLGVLIVMDRGQYYRAAEKERQTVVTVEASDIADVLLVQTPRLRDMRGFFTESWSRTAFAQAGIDVDFVQDNHSYSAQPHTLRGLHFQHPPFAQAKLVRCLRGAVLDVAVDLRIGSPSFGQYVKNRLSAENGAQIFVPVGFAHGFLTLEADCEISYKVSAPYSREHEGALLWSDEELGIDWGVDPNEVILSPKDTNAPRLAEFASPFAVKAD
jgi:dTDP-4-dehydrorhamnose 3,5-epimerase